MCGVGKGKTWSQNTASNDGCFSNKTQNSPVLSRQSITQNNVGIMVGYSEKGLPQLNVVVLGLRTRILSLLCLGVMAGPLMSPPSCHHCDRELSCSAKPAGKVSLAAISGNEGKPRSRGFPFSADEFLRCQHLSWYQGCPAPNLQLWVPLKFRGILPPLGKLYSS